MQNVYQKLLPNHEEYVFRMISRFYRLLLPRSKFFYNPLQSFLMMVEYFLFVEIFSQQA